jgi:serralysin
MPIATRPSFIEAGDAAAGAGTTYTLALGSTVQGSLTAGDHDFFRVNLIAGQVYSFALTGTGVNNVKDTLLKLYSADGISLLSSDDDGLPGNNSTLTYTAQTTGSYYIDASAYTATDTGQYGLSVTAGNRNNFDLNMAAGVIDSDNSWSPVAGAGAVVTYGFRQSAASYTAGSNIGSFTQVSTVERAAVKLALQLWTDATGIVFQEVNSGGFTDNATILIGNYTDSTDGAGAFAYYPGSTASASSAGDLWLNTNSVSTTSIPVGSYSFFAVMHELGHAIGLSHPGLYNAAPNVSITYANNAQFTQDSQQYSVMSYFDESSTGASYNYANTPMLADILAAQNIYGANAATRTGDTIYGSNSNIIGATASVYNFGGNTTPAFCIWDAGGIDTIDASGYATNQIINLNEGAFSSIGTGVNNISIAMSVTIENAIGGNGADTIILDGRAQDNVIDGALGNDTVYETYNFGSGYLLRSGGTANNFMIVGAAGSDNLQNIEFVHFADGTTVSTAALVGSSPIIARTNDFNGDGQSDILWKSTNGSVVQWLMSGSQVSSYAGIGGDANWSIAGTGDFNGDGKADILWKNTNGSVVEWLMNGSQVSFYAGIGGDANWSIAATGDFNGDGKADILWKNTNGSVVEWLMNGSQVSSYAGIGGDANWSIAGTGDFNGDGKADILWKNSNGSVVEWQMNGTQITSYTGIGGDANWSIAGTGDFNGDGKTDILWKNINGAVVEWLMNGALVTAYAGIGGDSNWSIAGTGDFNGDGKTDILWSNTNGLVVEWLMNGTDVISYAGIGGSSSWLVV